MLHILLTGATGNVGRAIFYELLLHIHHQKAEICLHLLVRNSKGNPALQRVAQLFANEGTPQTIQNVDVAVWQQYYEVIATDLHQLEGDNLSKLAQQNVWVLHCAASTNLLNNEAARLEIYKENYLLTQFLFDKVKSFCKKFIFVSTAYSAGIRKGLIPNQYLDLLPTQYRNHYEYYKALTEKELSAQCKTLHIDYQILRPSVVCGRLLEEPFYYTPRFDVFYGWAKFFYKIMASKNFAELPIRIWANLKGGTNVVPVDYVGKAVARAIFDNNITELVIANSVSAPYSQYLPAILEQTNCQSYQFVDTKPDHLNALERLYYQKVGDSYNQYLCGEPFEFEVSKLRKLMYDFPEPSPMRDFEGLFAFAKNLGFKDV